MLLKNAIKKLENAGYTISSNLGSYIATLNGVTISFHSRGEKTSNFTYDSDSSCAPTYGLNLKQAMN
mgnify:CR=1 FL=1